MAKYVGMSADLKFKRTLFTGRPVSPKTQYGLYHGDFKPIRVFEVLPSDTWKIKYSELVRMSTPVAPIMDNIRKETVAFFVPKRIIWNKTKQFYGEAPDKGIATPINEPTITISQLIDKSALAALDITAAQYNARTIHGAFNFQQFGASGSTKLNVLPFWAYASIYNEYVRNENYQSSYLWDKDLTGALTGIDKIWSHNGSFFGAKLEDGANDEITQWLLARNDGNDFIAEPLAKVNKDTDLFTSITPWQVKGSPITFPLGADLPIIADESIHDMGNNLLFGRSTGSALNFTTDNTTYTANGLTTNRISKTNMMADGSKAAILISDVIYALAYQNFLTKAAHYGTRYKEYIYSIFGSKVPDLTADVPEWLGRVITPINIDEVLQTTGFATGSGSTLGQPGANSRTGNTGLLVSKSFTEPGYIMICTYTKHDRTYGQSVDELFFKNELLDYYQSPFANISDVPISKDRLMLGAGDTALGFQEPHYDYKQFRDTTLDFMNPAQTGSLSYWSLADAYDGSTINITDEFLKEDRANIVRCLTTGELGPDFICDSLFTCEVSRIVPAHSRLGVL